MSLYFCIRSSVVTIFFTKGLPQIGYEMIWTIVVLSCRIYFSVCLLVHGLRAWSIPLVGGLLFIYCRYVQFFGVNQLVFVHFRLGAHGRVLFLFNRYFFFPSPGHLFLFIGALHQPCRRYLPIPGYVKWFMAASFVFSLN